MRFGYRPDFVSMELVGGGVPDAPLLELSLEFVGRGALIAPLLALPVEPVGAVIDRPLYRFEYGLQQNRSCRLRAIDNRPYGIEGWCLRHGLQPPQALRAGSPKGGAKAAAVANVRTLHRGGFCFI